jgi:Histidine kinase-like ATPase domain
VLKGVRIPPIGEFSAVCVRGASAPSWAREAIEERFAGSLEPFVLEAMQLIASELITNAVEHSTGEISLCVAVHDRRARIEVTDGSADCEPIITPLGDELAAGGRGLRLVEAFSTQWGCTPNGTQKMVWAEIDLPAHSSGTSHLAES